MCGRCFRAYRRGTGHASLHMAGRYHPGRGNHIAAGRELKVAMKVSGTATAPAAKLMTITPLDFDRQHVRLERFQSAEMLEKPPTARHPERRQVIWTLRAGATPGLFTVRHDFYCDIDVHSPSLPMSSLARSFYATPMKGEHLENEPLIESDHPDISALARRLIEDREGTYDQMEAIYQHVSQEVENDPNVGMLGLGAVECLHKPRRCAGEEPVIGGMCAIGDSRRW